MLHCPSPCVAEGDGCVEYPVAGTQALAEAGEVLLQAHHTVLIQAAVGHGMGQHQDAEVGRVGAANLRGRQDTRPEVSNTLSAATCHTAGCTLACPGLPSGMSGAASSSCCRQALLLHEHQDPSCIRT